MKTLVIAAFALVSTAALAVPNNPGQNPVGPWPTYEGPECTQDTVMWVNNGSNGRTRGGYVYFTCVDGKLVDLSNTNPAAPVPSHHARECTHDEVLYKQVMNNGRVTEVATYYYCVKGHLIEKQ
jgi:hypothetical protein